MRDYVYFCSMKQHEEVTFQTLADNEDIQIGYSDNDIVVVDSIQQFEEINQRQGAGSDEWHTDGTA